MNEITNANDINDKNSIVNQKINANQIFSKQFEFISLVARLSTLVTCCLTMTLISIGLFIFNASVGNHSTTPNFGVAAISIFGPSMDVMVNAICLVLHWPYAKSWFKNICTICPCHRYCIRYFVKRFKFTPLYDQLGIIKMGGVAQNVQTTSDSCDH